MPDVINWRQPIQPAQICWQAHTPISMSFGEGYFSDAGGSAESKATFIEANQLVSRFSNASSFTIAELGFGTGLNFLLSAQLWQQTAPHTSWLDYVGFELEPILKQDLVQIHSYWPELKQPAVLLQQHWPLAIPGYHLLTLPTLRTRCLLIYGDARHHLPQLNAHIDCWFLDGFSPGTDDALWQPEVFDQIKRLSHAQTTLSTYSVARRVKEGVLSAGFCYQLKPGVGQKRHRLEAHNSSKLTAQQRSSPSGRKIAIVGTGLAGLCLGHSLQQRGFHITFIENHSKVAQGASGAPATVILPWLSMDLNLDAQWSLQSYLTAIEYWRKPLFKLAWHPSPVLLRPRGTRDLAQLLTTHPALNAIMESVTAKNSSSRKGHTETQSMLFSAVGWLNPALAARSLYEHLGPSCQFLFEHCLVSLENRSSKWICSFTNGAEAEFDTVVLANAHGIQNLKQTACNPIQAVAGQVDIFSTSDLVLAKQILCEPGFAIPLGADKLGVGSTFERELFSTQEASHKLMEQLLRHYPQCSAPQVHTQHSWRGTRACTPDRIPLVGLAPNYQRAQQQSVPKIRPPSLETLPFYDGLYLFSGFGSRGMTHIPACAAVLSAQLEGTVAPWPTEFINRLKPVRFLQRALKADR